MATDITITEEEVDAALSAFGFSAIAAQRTDMSVSRTDIRTDMRSALQNFMFFASGNGEVP